MNLTGYTRWRRNPDGTLTADILGLDGLITVDPTNHTVILDRGDPLTPDEARLIGVRLIDAAVLADGDRAIRSDPGATR